MLAASMAVAAFTQKGAGKDKAKPVCRNFMTDEGCKRGGQCASQHLTSGDVSAVALPVTC